MNNEVMYVGVNNLKTQENLKKLGDPEGAFREPLQPFLGP